MNEIVERNKSELQIQKQSKRVERKGFYINIDKEKHKKLKAYALIKDATMTEVIEAMIDKHCKF